MQTSEKRASSEIANERKTAGKDKGKACKHLFKYTPIHPLPKKKNSFLCQNVKSPKGTVYEGFTCSACLLDSARAKPNDWRTCWSKLLQLTNHRVYQELLYRNEELKTILTSSTTSFLPSPHTVFAQLFSIRFSHSGSLDTMSTDLPKRLCAGVTPLFSQMWRS